MSTHSPGVDRRLAAFWFADIAGFTTLSATDEHAALAAVETLRQAAREHVGRAGGRVVKLSGDAVLAEFPSSDAALRSAIALRDALHPGVPLHTGVHLGEVSEQHGDIYGDGVNIAARLQAHAATGQILASEDVYRQVRASAAFRFEPVGALTLKGVATPVAAYLVEPDPAAPVAASPVAGAPATGEPPRTAGRSAEPTRTTPSNRLIVAPFRLLRSDEETAFLAFSLADAVSFSLSGIEAIVVRSTSVAGTDAATAVIDPREVARRSDVDLVVTGTLLRVGDRLQVTAELSDGRDGTRLASFRNHAGLGDLFELQEEMSQRIVEALALPLTTRERRLMTQDVPATARAYELYLRANEMSYRIADWARARDLYRAALAEDPRYAPAWARLGRCLRLIAKYSEPELQKPGLAEAEAALARALELNPDLDLAHSYSAQLETELGRCGDAMRRLLARLETRPRGVDLLIGLVQSLRYCGLLDESLQADEAARAIDPSARTSVAYTLFLRGDFDVAARAGTESDQYLRAMAQLVLDRPDEARATLAPLLAGSSPFQRFLVPVIAFLDGRNEAAINAGADLYQSFPDPEGHYFFARILAWVGEGSRALQMLEAIAPGYAALPPPGLDPWLAGVDRTEEYQRILRSIEPRRAEAREHYRAAPLAFAR
jgi:class 3 adenylate cyclase/TolB-like protein